MTPNIYQQYVITSTVTPFISTWNTSNVTAGSSTNVRVKLPLVSTGTYNFVVDWGDSTTDTITAYNQAALSSATYVLTINGVTGLSNSSYCYISAGAGSSNGYFSVTTNKTSTMYSDGTQVGLFFQIR